MVAATIVRTPQSVGSPCTEEEHWDGGEERAEQEEERQEAAATASTPSGSRLS